MTRARRQGTLGLGFYWPHLGIFVGIGLNAAGLVTGRDGLIGTGANVLTVSGLFLAQRRRNRRGTGDDG